MVVYTVTLCEEANTNPVQLNLEPPTEIYAVSLSFVDLGVVDNLVSFD